MKNPFLDRLQHFINEQSLFSTQQTIIIALSGGVDSMVLAHALGLLGYHTLLAHCNFGLRGEESESETQWLQSFFQQKNTEVLVKYFDTTQYQYTQKVSVQVAARELRYQWFNELLSLYEKSVLATGHHLSDSVETIIYNLIKGKENQLLKGISVRRGNIVRPLLWASKNEIYTFAQSQNIPFVTDSSNFKDDYQRNLIRNQIIPLMAQINPNIECQLTERSYLYNLQSEIVNNHLCGYIKTLLEHENGFYYIDIFQLIDLELTLQYTCWRMICMDYIGLDARFTNELKKLWVAQTGKKMYNKQWIAYRDRTHIIIGLQNLMPQNKDYQAIVINLHDISFYFGNYSFQAQIIEPHDSENKSEKYHFIFPVSQITFPLVLRCWQNGDVWRNRKGFFEKVKDTLAAESYPAHIKKWAFIIENQSKIIYVENINFKAPPVSIQEPCWAIQIEKIK